MNTIEFLPQVQPRKQRHSTLMIYLSILIMGGFIAGLVFFKKLQIDAAIKKNASFQMPADAITAMTVHPQAWEHALEAVGSLSAAQGVMISADLPGVVMQTPLQSGAMVKKGDLLVQQDTRQEEAQLHLAESKLALALIKLERAKDLAEKNVIAKSAFDDVQAEYSGALASAEEIKAIIARKTIVAPFDGMLGLCQVNEGQYLQSGAPIVPLNLLDIIRVNFALPQQDLGKLKLGQEVRIQADGFPNEIFKGTITAINSEVDPATRNILIQATINNDKLLLRGGMFANVEVILPTRNKVIAVPVSAVNYAPYGASVFIIQKIKNSENPKGKPYLGVREQSVTLGATRGDLIEIRKGLKDGDEIATSGVFKLRSGSPVKINNEIQPGSEANPNPIDS